MKVRYTPRALSDLRSILEYIDERNPRGTQNVKRAIRKTIELIGEYPEGGRAAG
jgi:plasmid stabilization system protein ParE